MANWLEKRLKKDIRTQLRTFIAAGLGFFLGMRYNDYFGNLLNVYLPADGLAARTLILIVVTVIVAYIAIMVQRGLDGE